MAQKGGGSSNFFFSPRGGHVFFFFASGGGIQLLFVEFSILKMFFFSYRFYYSILSIPSLPCMVTRLGISHFCL